MKDESIFLLEPDQLVQEAFIDILEEEGYTLFPLQNPWESLSLLRKVSFQIAILDTSLGDFNLWELISELGKIEPRPSIILTMIKPELEEILAFHNWGVDAILLKPVSAEELLQVLKRAEANFLSRQEGKLYRQELARLEEEKSQIEEGLKRAAHSLHFAELASSFTHEIKNALTTINLSLHYIKNRISSDDPKLLRHFELIQESLSFANELTLKILGLAREKKQLLDFNTLLEETVAILEAELKNRGVRVLKSFTPGLPELFLDATALRQVLINLILNAKEAMKEGGQLSLKTYLREEKDGAYLVVEVGDTGTGIAPEAMDKIFLPSYSSKEKGSGLGLYISKRIVEEMGGRIEVESRLGKGSRFKVLLPSSKKEGAAVLEGEQG